MAMTQIEMYEHIMTLTSEIEVQDFCTKKIAQLKSKKSTSKLKPEDVELRAAIATLLADTEGAMTAKMVAEEVGCTARKASGALTAMYKNGTVDRITPADKNAPYAYAIDGE